MDSSITSTHEHWSATFTMLTFTRIELAAFPHLSMIFTWAMISLYGVGYVGAWLAEVAVIAWQPHWSYLWSHSWNDLMIVKATASFLSLWLGRCMAVARVASKFKVKALTLIETTMMIIVVAKEEQFTVVKAITTVIKKLHQKFDWFYRLSFLRLSYAS